MDPLDPQRSALKMITLWPILFHPFLFPFWTILKEKKEKQVPISFHQYFT